MTFATDLYDPKLLGTKSVTDVNGGDVVVGDVLRYTVPVQNIGLDTASRSRFFDAIPTGTTYVPGTITVNGEARTDAADGVDTAQFVPGDNGGYVLAYLGTGATPTRGGGIPISLGSAQYTVTFDVRVNADVTAGQQLTNAAALTYRGLTTDASSSSATNAVITPVVAGGGVDLPPTATPHVVTFTPTAATPTLTLPVLADDTDPEGLPLRVVAVTDAAGGAVAIGADEATVTYTPRADAAGRDVFTYTIEDMAGNRSTATIQVEVLNTAPQPGDDAVTVPAGAPTVVDVLAGDTDPNGDALSVRSAGPASTQGGTVTVVDGVVTYAPPAGFTGTDTFTYVVADSRGGASTGTVTVTVTNTPPVAADDAYVTDEGVAVTLDLLGNDTDANGDTLSVTGTTGETGGGMWVVGLDGTGTWTPPAGFTGTATLTYTVSDGKGGTDTATVEIDVNGRPTAVDDSATTPAGTAVSFGVLGNDTDPDGDPLTASLTVAAAHGSVLMNADGTTTYTPDAGWAGADTFTYRVSDGRLTDTATVTVTTQNAAPVANPDTASTPTNTPLVGIDVVANDSDVNVTAGVPGQALSVTGATADHDATVTVAPDGTLTVTPATGYTGTVTVSYTLSDGAGGTATGTLTVTVANGVPSAVADTASTPTDVAVLVDVTGNDSDPNGDALTLVPGSLTGPVDADGDPAGTAAIEAGQIRFTPAPGFAGTASLDYTVSDGRGGTATGHLTITVANASPVAVGEAVTTPSGTAVTVDVLANDSDANVGATDQVLSVIDVGTPVGVTVARNADGTLLVTPWPGFEGVVSIPYTVGDGAGGTATGTLTVTVLNAPPVAVDDAATTPYATGVDVDLLANDTDVNVEPLTVVVDSLTTPVDAGGNPRGTVSVTGGVARYVPPAGFSGVVTFTYDVTDGTARTTATVTVTVGNAPPVAVDDTAATPAGRAVTIRVVGNDSDPDSDDVRIASVTQPARGTVTVVDGALVFTPAPGQTGSVTFTYTVVDAQGATATASVTVVVAAVPTGSPLPATGAEVAGPLGLAALALLLGAVLVVVSRRRRSV